MARVYRLFRFFRANWFCCLYRMNRTIGVLVARHDRAVRAGGLSERRAMLSWIGCCLILAVGVASWATPIASFAQAPFYTELAPFKDAAQQDASEIRPASHSFDVRPSQPVRSTALEDDGPTMGDKQWSLPRTHAHRSFRYSVTGGGSLSLGG